MVLTHENYHSQEANMEYISASQIKSFVECEERTLASLTGEYQRETSTALLQGQYFDSFFDGSKILFEGKNNVFKRGGGKYAHYESAEEAYNRAEQDEAWMHYAASGEQQVIMTGLIQGVPAKIMIDSLLVDEAIVDRKYMKDFKEIYKDGMYVSFARGWGYDIQGGLYQTIGEQNIGKKLPFIIAGVTKEKEPDIELFNFYQETLDNGYAVVVSVAERLQDVKQGKIQPTKCSACDWCRRTKKLIFDIGRMKQL